MAIQSRNITSIVSSNTFDNNLTNLNTDSPSIGANSNDSTRSIRLALADPAGTLTGVQTITIRHRWGIYQNSQQVSSQVDAVEAGSSTSKAVMYFNSTNPDLLNTPPVNTSTFTFNASVLADQSGKNLELLFTLNTSNGANGCALTYVTWDAQYSDRKAVRYSYWL